MYDGAAGVDDAEVQGDEGSAVRLDGFLDSIEVVKLLLVILSPCIREEDK